MPFVNGVAGATMVAGNLYDRLQPSTTDMSLPTTWFSPRARRQLENGGVAPALRGTLRATTPAVGLGRQHQSTAFKATTDTQHSDSYHSSDSSGRPCTQCPLQWSNANVMHADGSVRTAPAAAAAAARVGRNHSSQPIDSETFDTSRQDDGAPGGSSARRCARCPLGADGKAVLHAAISPPCKAACACTVCGSDSHMEHGCFIAHGLGVQAPSTVRATRSTARRCQS